MEKTLKQTAIKISKETAFILLTIAGAVILPQIFHGAGVLFGVGGQLGQMFLPMYLPILILGFYRGAASGAIVGLLAPLVSFAITGMPGEAILPYITVELIAMGLLAGAFSNLKTFALVRVLLVQIIAKAIRLCAFAIGTAFMGNTLTATSLFSGILTSIPGVLLQLVVVTYLIVKKEKKCDA